MPELPEVETVRRVLENKYLNKTITKISIIYPKMIKTDLNEFENKIVNQKLISVTRKGKYLFLNFSNHYSIISHLRMEGKYIQRDITEDNTPYSRVVFYLDDDTKLCYDDSRCFGVMYLSKTDEIFLNKEVSKLGLEPFDIKDANYLFQKYKKSNNEIKALLLDQSIMCGLGNIYCDEVLFKSKLNPYQKGKTLTLQDCENILHFSIETLNHAIQLGGSTVSSYHPEKGVDGKFQNELNVYGKEKKSCVMCKTTLRKDKLKGRGTTYCPKCQNVAISVGLTGKIASGKSSVLDIFKKLGAVIFSSDQEVNNLYHEIEFKKQVINIFKESVLNDDLSISKNEIKKQIEQDPNKKIQLENLIHPIIKQKIINFIQKNKCQKLIVVEVPLLFESHMNNLFDYIIGVSCSFDNQIMHLKNRGSKNTALDISLNNSNKFDQNAHKCNFIINNDGTYQELENQVKDIYSQIISW